jgi:hypothetical protein
MKEMGYNRIPRHIEEAAIFFKSVAGISPDLCGLKINPETEKRFLQFISVAEQRENVPSAGVTKIQKTFGNTFWFYNEFK